MLLPAVLRDFAKIDKKMMMVGQGKNLSCGVKLSGMQAVKRG